MSFEENIKEWVSLDNKIKQYNEQLKHLREKRSQTEVEIIEHSESLPENTAIKISDGMLKFADSKVQQPLTYKFLHECLSNVITNEEKVTQIMNYIKQNRGEKKIKGIRRLYEN